MEISLINGHPWSYFKPDNRFFVFRVLFKISNDKFWSGLATFSGCIRVHRLFNARYAYCWNCGKDQKQIQFLIVNFSLVKSHSKKLRWTFKRHWKISSMNAIKFIVQELTKLCRLLNWIYLFKVHFLFHNENKSATWFFSKNQGIIDLNEIQKLFISEYFAENFFFLSGCVLPMKYFSWIQS